VKWNKPVDIQSVDLAIWRRLPKITQDAVSANSTQTFNSLPKQQETLSQSIKIPILARYNRKILPVLPILRTRKPILLKIMPLKKVILRQSFCIALVLVFAVPCFAQQQSLSEADKQFTADVLKIMLFARPGDEWKFCEYVIQKRDDGTLPRPILYGVYRKAMEKDRYRRFTYFKLALEIVCQREGIALYPTPTKTTPTSTAVPSTTVRLPFFNGRF
jgi:hypothetical protein